MTLQAVQNLNSAPKPPETLDDAWPDLLDRQTRFQQVLHHNHWRDRHRIIASLMKDPVGRLQPLARRLSTCGNGASIFIDPDKSKPTAWISRCGSKLCPFCSNARSAHTRDDLIPLILKHGCQRMMVLTLRSSNLPLADQIVTLLAAFKRLRHRKLWRDKITGGIRVIEITMNEKTRQWHPHIHLLFRGQYIHQPLVKALWKEITTDSSIVFIQKVNNADGMAAELAKYIGKPQRIATLSPTEIRQYARATKGLRMIQTFGDCHNRNLQQEDKPADRPRTDHRVNLSTLIHLARNGHAAPARLLELVAQRWTIFAHYIWHELPQLDPMTPAERKAAARLRVKSAPRAPPVIKPEHLAEPELLDAWIVAAYWTCLDELKAGVYQDVHTYYATGTEDLHGDLRG